MKIDMPIGAEKIINTLQINGYEAFIVGGCVRDALLSRKADDFDITTSAMPHEVKSLFERTVDTGIEHGTVSVIEFDAVYEVTTYRIDGEYSDNRHPLSVQYTKNIEDDLSRRDFTINAMAYNNSVGIVDTFGGICDLKNRIIRAVGDPAVRFTEDALRILRCLRFSSVLGFDIEENTSNLAIEKSALLKHVSSERIYTEWKKLISGCRAPSIIKKYADVFEVFLPEIVGNFEIDEQDFLALDRDERQIYLFAASGNIDKYDSAMQRLKTDKRIREWGNLVISKMSFDSHPTEKELKKLCISKDDSAVLSAVKISEALKLCEKGTYISLVKIMSDNPVRRLDMLNISGKDLIKLGYTGEMIGTILNELLEKTAVGELENKNEDLMLYASSKK